MKIAFGADHAGLELKNTLMAHAQEQGYEVKDYGCYEKVSVDYPKYGFLVGKAVANGECDLGVVVCGTGAGISIAANKVKGVRAVACSEPYTARMCREHNNANVLGIGARVVGDELAKTILDAYLSASFLGDRHARRVNMLIEIDESGDLAAAHEG